MCAARAGASQTQLAGAFQEAQKQRQQQIQVPVNSLRRCRLEDMSANGALRWSSHVHTNSISIRGAASMLASSMAAFLSACDLTICRQGP